MWNKHRRLFVSAFILILLYVSWLLVSPPCLWQRSLLRPIKAVLSYAGLTYPFALFRGLSVPENKNIVCEIHYNDGTTASWPYPSATNMTYLEQLVNWRFRKFGYDFLDKQKDMRNNLLWPDFARYVVRLNDTSARHPIDLQFIEFSSKVPPPSAPHMVPPVVHRVLFVYHVQPEEPR